MSHDDDISQLSPFASAGHTFFASDGVKLAFGKRWDGKIVHVSAAKRGAACGCVCPAQECGRKLIARKPDTAIAHHFAHAPLTPSERLAGIAPNCQHAGMTALHAYAEQLLNERKSLVLPPVEATVGLRFRRVRSAKEYGFDAARLEKMDGETIPDVILEKSGQQMHVEIFVTHRCGAEKRAKIIAANISAVEIDLSSFHSRTPSGLDEAILRTAPRIWLHNRRAEKLRLELQQEAMAEAERARAKRPQEIARLARAYASAEERAWRSNWSDDGKVKAAIEAGHAKLLEGSTGGEGYFTIHPKVWKAAIFGELLGHYAGTTPDSAARDFQKRGWLAQDFIHLVEGDERSSEAGLPKVGLNKRSSTISNFCRVRGSPKTSVGHGNIQRIMFRSSNDRRGRAS